VGRPFILLPLLLAAVAVPAADAAGVLTSARHVRYAIPAVEAYAADHHGYKGMTLAKIRKWDKSIAQIRIRTATKRTYCIESTTRPFAHKAGPGAAIRTGHCGQRGTAVDFDPAPLPPPTTAEQKIRYAIPAMEAYAADHNGYAGMTIAALRKYDVTVADLTIVRATRATYCVENRTGADQLHKDGRGAPITFGPCPTTRRLMGGLKVPGEGTLKPDPEDMGFARRAQLTPKDFPPGTRRDPKRYAGVFLLPRCAGFYEPDRTDLVATGSAEAYFRSPYGSYVGSAVTVWRNRHDSDAYWARVLTPRYPTCLARNLAAWHKPGVRTRVLYVKRVPARYTLGERRTAYEIAIHYTSRTRSEVYVRAAFFFENDRAIGVTMAGGVGDACGCTANLAGLVYARMRPTPGG